MTISEQTVKAMPGRIYAVKRTEGSNCVVSFDTPSLDYNVEYVRADLAPFLPVQGAVKKLEWELVSGDHYAEGAGTHYNIYETKPGLWNSVTVKPGNVRLATNVDLEAAKSAAQSDFESRILSALEPAAGDMGNPITLDIGKPITAPSAARELALEEAARNAAMYLATGFITCPRCGEDVETKNTDAEYALRAALSSPDHADAGKVEGDGWLPISSAPKDGTPFLVFVPDDDFSSGTGIDVIWYDEEQWLFGANTPFIPANDPTHWRPLPSAPASEGAE